MPAPLTSEQRSTRNAKVLTAARWCFLNFGFAKTSFEDIARRAALSRTLLYRQYKTKDDLYRAVFADWLVARHPIAKAAAKSAGAAAERLLTVCRVIALEPWAEMVTAPMGAEFLAACSRIDPKSEALHRKVALDSVAAILGDKASAEVFVLALDGLLADQPTVKQLEARTRVLVSRFVEGAR